LILAPPVSVQKLQTALQAKAKGAPDYRFYLLYDKLYRKDVLTYAYQRCKANKGAPGIDHQDSRTSRRTGKSVGSANWRTHSTERRIELTRSDAFGYRKREASSARSGFPVLRTVW
jgi:hypothetical protein